MLVNNTQVSTTIGQNLTGTYAKVDFNTDNLIDGAGTVFASIKWYRSEADYDAATIKDLAIIYPTDNGDVINAVSFEVALSDVVKASGTCLFSDVFAFFGTKVLNYLNAEYGWDVVLG